MGCAGSSPFLKSKLGVGYTLTYALDLAAPDPDAVIAVTRSHVPALELLATSRSEVSIRLPMSEVPKFASLFEEIDAKKDAIGVRGYGISVTTLEEIFLRIGVEEEEADDAKTTVSRKPAAHAASRIVVASSDSPPDTQFDGGEGAATNANVPYATPDDKLELSPPETMGPIEEEMSPSMLAAKRRQEACQKMTWDNEEVVAAEDGTNRRGVKSKYTPTPGGQLFALLLKRVRYAKRDMRTIVLQVVMPIVCICLAMLIDLVEFPDAVPLRLRADAYPQAEYVYGGCPAAFGEFPDPGSLMVMASPNTTNAFNTSTYLLNSYNNHTHPIERVVGVHCLDTRMVEKVPVPLPNGSTSVVSLPTPSAVLFVNESLRHGAPMALSEFHGTWFRALRNVTTPLMTLTSYPLRFNEREEAQADAIFTLLIGMFILVPFTFIPSTFVSFVVKERECKAKHLQVVSGMNYFVYWISNFIFDIACFLVTSLIVLCVFGIFQRDEYVGSAVLFFAMLVLFLLYGLAGVTGSYFVSFGFDSHATAQNIVMLANFVCGFLLVLVIYIMQFIESTEDVAKVLRYFFRIVPSYCLGEGIINVASLLLIKSVLDEEPSPFELDIIGWPLIYLAGEFFLFGALTLAIDHPSRRMRQHQLLASNEPPTPIENEDADVAEERAAVESGSRDATDVVTVKNLNKVYPIPTEPFEKVAVKNLSFGVKPHEVFAFLGTNGAGKTTSISVLCGEFMPTKGHGYVMGNHVVDNAADARAQIGYCPQFDALHDLLTPMEHLMLYAELRGMPNDRALESANILMEACDLIEHQKKPTNQLSGGNKRKLSLALSLIGQPAVCFLDEPSAGMDPKARRAMWDVIEHLSRHCSVVLTTHHLEEVEVLAHRAAIMVDGELRCVGSLQHLKNRFGSGFELALRIVNAGAADAVQAEIARALPLAVLKEQRNLRFTYALPQEVQLSETFRAVEAAKAVGIEDYSLAQSSIEQVFLRISADAVGDE